MPTRIMFRVECYDRITNERSVQYIRTTTRERARIRANEMGFIVGRVDIYDPPRPRKQAGVSGRVAAIMTIVFIAVTVLVIAILDRQ